MQYDEAIAYLEARASLGIRPGLDRIRPLLASMGDPQSAYPVIHVAGTNGKTTTARLAAHILAAHRLSVGAFTSPPLAAVEENFMAAGEQMRRAELGPAIADVAPFVELTEAGGEPAITQFEILTAAAFAWFLERSVDVAVIEAGLGGTDDATNAASGKVAVITSIGADHADVLGDTPAQVAAAKAGIVDEGAVLVTGPLPAEAEGPVAARVADVGAAWRRLGADFRVEATQAVGGWLADVDGVYERYEDILLPLHGRHQPENLALAVVAAEEMLGRALAPGAVREGAAAVRVPGRIEVVPGDALVVLDVAHNPDGVAALAAALTEEFLPTRWVVVFGVRGARDPAAMLAPLAGKVERLYATAADDPAAIAAGDVASRAAEALGPAVPVEVAEPVAAAVAKAIAAAGTTGGVVVAGSHRVVGEARAALLGGP